MSNALINGMVEAYENAVMPIGSRLTFEEAEYGMREALRWLAANLQENKLPPPKEVMECFYVPPMGDCLKYVCESIRVVSD